LVSQESASQTSANQKSANQGLANQGLAAQASGGPASFQLHWQSLLDADGAGAGETTPAQLAPSAAASANANAGLVLNAALASNALPKTIAQANDSTVNMPPVNILAAGIPTAGVSPTGASLARRANLLAQVAPGDESQTAASDGAGRSGSAAASAKPKRAESLSDASQANQPATSPVVDATAAIATSASAPLPAVPLNPPPVPASAGQLTGSVAGAKVTAAYSEFPQKGSGGARSSITGIESGGIAAGAIQPGNQKPDGLAAPQKPEPIQADGEGNSFGGAMAVQPTAVAKPAQPGEHPQAAALAGGNAAANMGGTANPVSGQASDLVSGEASDFGDAALSTAISLQPASASAANSNPSAAAVLTPQALARQARREGSSTAGPATAPVSSVQGSAVTGESAASSRVPEIAHGTTNVAGSSSAGTGSSGSGTKSGVSPQATFAALDSAPGGTTPSCARAGSQQAEAGFEDPTLGWIGVRADVTGSSIHAALMTGSPEAAQALSAHLPGLSAYLSDQHSGVSVLTMNSPGDGGVGSGTGQSGQQNGGQTAQQSSAGSESYAAQAEPGAPAMSSLNEAAYSFGASSGTHVSVMA
jgi:hypothetical protein